MKDQETDAEAKRQPHVSHLFPKSSIAAGSITASSTENKGVFGVSFQTTIFSF